MTLTKLSPLALALALLAGCGVDGPPVAPQTSVSPGVSTSAEARVGVVYNR